MGTKGALMDLLISAFQLTFSNQGWLRISSEELAPNLSFGFFYSNRIRIFCNFGEACIDECVRWELGEVDRGSIRTVPFYSGYGREEIRLPFRR